jgi:hypothetical protein
MHFINPIGRSEMSALMTIVAILIAAMLAKLGLGWWAIAATAAPCLLGGMRKAVLAMKGWSHANIPASVAGINAAFSYDELGADNGGAAPL